MTQHNLPELPESDEHMQGKELAPGVYESGYTADQMRAYALAALSSQGAVEAVGYLVSIDDEPEVGDWFSKDDCSQHGYTCKPLYTRPQAAQAAQPLSEQDAELINQAHEMLLEFAADQSTRGNDSTAKGAECSADAVLRLGAQAAKVKAAQPARVVDDLLERCAKWCDEQATSDWYGQKASDMVRAFAKCGQLSTLFGMPVVVDESMPSGQVKIVHPAPTPSQQAACGCSTFEQQHCRAGVAAEAQHPDCVRAPSQTGAVTELEAEAVAVVTELLNCLRADCIPVSAYDKAISIGDAFIAAFEAKKAGGVL